jgi:hypothetical protein
MLTYPMVRRGSNVRSCSGGANSEGGNAWVHIRTPVDLHPQLRLASMAECINTSKKSEAQNSHLRVQSHRGWSRHNPSSQNFLQSTALANSRSSAGDAACEHGKSAPAFEPSQLLKQAERVLLRRLGVKTRLIQPFSCTPQDLTHDYAEIDAKKPLPPLLRTYDSSKSEDLTHQRRNRRTTPYSHPAADHACHVIPGGARQKPAATS